MTKTTIVVLMAGLAAAASEVRAQTPPAPASVAFVNINVGAQPQRRNIGKTSSLTLYEETATFTTEHPIGNGPLFDASGGYRVWRGLAVGIGISSFSKNGVSTVTATIPDPLFFGRSKTTTTTSSSLQHTERGVHVQAVWFVPVTEKIDVALSFGPSFIKVSQQLVSSITVPVATQNVNVVLDTQKGTAKGVNVGFDGTYLFSRNLGVGLFARYAGGKVDLPAAAALKVGGFHAGLGARIRF